MTPYSEARSEMVAPVTGLPVDEAGAAVLRLGPGLAASDRAALARALDAAFADPRLRVIVLSAAGRGWPGPADPVEAETAPALGSLVTRIAGSPVPVIAALRGPVLGASLSLALAAHWRIAQEGARLGFPEAGLGLCPFAGATQRLPALIGARPALNLFLSALPVPAAQALRLGLVDSVVPGDAEVAALELAQSCQDTELAPWTQRAVRADDPGAYLDAIASARAALGRRVRLPAPGRIIDCVEAALLLPEAEGLEFERWTVRELADTAQARALGHVARAERALAERRPAARPLAVARIGVVGGTEAGALVVAAALGAGIEVTLAERGHEALAGALARVAAMQERAVATGRLDAAARAAAWARLGGTTDLAALADCDLVLSALGSDEDDELLLFSDLGTLLRPGSVLACGSDMVELTGLCAVTGRPEATIGLRFATAGRLAEVAVPPSAAPATVATGMALAQRLGRIAVATGPEAGGLVTRLRRALCVACAALLEQGATPAAIDRALVAEGFVRGPFEEIDRLGLDSAEARDWLGAATAGTRGARIGLMTGALLAAGRTGAAQGGGFHLYDRGVMRPDPDLGTLVPAGSAGQGGPGRDEILRTVLAALANEGARLVARGMAADPSVIDLVAVHGLGMPRALGGPMQAADEIGLLALRTHLRARVEAAGPTGRPGFWAPAPIWDELIRNGETFASRS